LIRALEPVRPKAPLGTASAAGAHPRLLAALLAAYSVAAFGAVTVVTMTFYPFFSAMQLPYAPFGLDQTIAGFALWVAICLATATQATHATGQMSFVYSIAPVMAAGLLGGPAAAALVALLGTVPIRALRDGTPRSDLLAGHIVRCLAATLGAVVMLGVRVTSVDPIQLRDLGAILIGTAVAVTVEQGLVLGLWSARTGRPVNEAFAIVSRVDWAVAAIAKACIAWLAALVYFQGLWWAPVLIVVADIAASRSMAHQESSWRIRHSEKTGLPTRHVLDQMWRDLPRGDTPQPSRCLVYLDLDGFKRINDDHGHKVGDDVLGEVGRRLQAAIGPDLFIAHMHGDEFVALATGVRDEAAAEAVIGRLRGLIDPTIEHAVRGPLQISATAGPCLLPPLKELKPARDDERPWSKDDVAKAELDGFLKAADEEMSRRKDRTGRRGGPDRRVVTEPDFGSRATEAAVMIAQQRPIPPARPQT
jgi:diguanylate cyclase (GGDEF)-like protein